MVSLVGKPLVNQHWACQQYKYEIFAVVEYGYRYWQYHFGAQNALTNRTTDWKGITSVMDAHTQTAKTLSIDTCTYIRMSTALKGL